jgi:transcriptional regulator with XRE-family HTH domain
LSGTQITTAKTKDEQIGFIETQMALVMMVMSKMIFTTSTKVESGAVNKPSDQTMAKIAKALGVSIEELI